MARARGKRRDAEVCIHEAAHLVSVFRLGLDPPDRVSVETEGPSAGWVNHGGIWGAGWTKELIRENPELKELVIEQRKRDERTVIGLLAGLATQFKRYRYSLDNAVSLIIYKSELLKHGFPSSDLQQALDLLKFHEPDAATRKKWFRGLCQQACERVWEWWPEIQMVAAVLQERRVLDREGIEEVCEKIETMKPTVGRYDWIAEMLTEGHKKKSA